MYIMKHLTLLFVSFVILFVKGEKNENAYETTEAKVSRLENLLMDFISKVQTIEVEKNVLRSQVNDLVNENHELRCEIDHLNNKNHELRSKMESIWDEMKDLTKKNHELKSDMETLKDKMKDVNDDVEHLQELSKILSVRTCDEMHNYGLRNSDYYFVDPDGPLNGEEPIRVYCEFTDNFGFTQISHDSEATIEVRHCQDPGCYSREIIYDSPLEQVKTLIELSYSCNQLIRYDCYLSPLEENMVTFGYWVDQNGQNQIYWSGENYGNHVCSCHFSEEGCVEEETLSNTCNCDSNEPIPSFDEGYITNSSALPIMGLKFGGLTDEAQLGFHTLGKLSCHGKNDAMYGPIIFSAYINSTQRFDIGEYISRFTGFLTNFGDSFTLSNGTFRAPRNGIYEFSASAYHQDTIANRLLVVKNEQEIILKFQDWYNEAIAVGDWDWTLTFNWIIELQKGDRVHLEVQDGFFICAEDRYCIFNGKYIM